MASFSVLTTSSDVTCGHQGKVDTSNATAKLKVNGDPVLRLGDVQTQEVSSSCTVQDDANSSSRKCRLVQQITQGEASKLKVEGQRVLLKNLQGTTDGLVGGTQQTLLSVEAAQTKLTAQ